MERESTCGFRKKNMLRLIVSLRQTGPHMRLEAWMTWIWVMALKSCLSLSARSPFLPQLSYQRSGLWRNETLSRAENSCELGEDREGVMYMCMGWWWWIRVGLELEERGDDDDGQTRGSPPPSIKAAGMSSGLVGPGTLFEPSDLIWCVKWGGESGLSSAHRAPEIQSRATGIQLVTRLKPALDKKKKEKEEKKWLYCYFYFLLLGCFFGYMSICYALMNALFFVFLQKRHNSPRNVNKSFNLVVPPAKSKSHIYLAWKKTCWSVIFPI